MKRLAIAACMMLGNSVFGQNLVVNGNFEIGNHIGGTFVPIPAGSTALAGWQVGNEDGIRWFDAFVVECFDGSKCVELNEQNPTSISQTIPTTAGTSYRLRFGLAGDPYGLAAFRTIRVHVGASAYDYEFNIIGHFFFSMGWREETIDFVAAGPSTLLRFESTSPQFAGPFIDNVRVEPTTPLCIADVDDGTSTGTRDGGVTVDDLLYYLFVFEAGATSADVDDGTSTGTPDGGVTIDDLLYFLLRFELGC